MDDVIFAGTSKLPQLGRAEVSLTIDNSAGLLPIEFTEVTITRLLFRSGDSEYAINGVPCRLLDIQELLSDSGVGRQQHVIISQGNIDGVLNARPEERRLIIEEAAGVLKYRRRKERAERRLQATEANLTRINDLLREVRRQLRPLERQADAARRHGDLINELSSLRIHLAGKELRRLRSQLEESSRTQTALRGDDQRLRAILADLDARILASEAQLSALGGRDLGDVLVRYEKVAEKGRGQVALLAERRRNLERELGASIDGAVIASLEAEHHQLSDEADQIERDGVAVSDELGSVEELEGDLAARRAAFTEEWGDGVPAPTGQASAVRGELAALRSAIGRTGADRERLALRQDSLGERVERLRVERDEADQLVRAAESGAPGLDTVASGAARARVAAEEVLARAEAAATDAETDASAWTARAEALDLALDEARQRAGAERLSGLDGVLGTLLDLVDVDPGWEEAFEAAAGEALGAVVVADVDAGRSALAALDAGDHRGAVLALGAGRVAIAAAASIDVGEPVRRHVRPASGAGASAAGIDAVLDALLADAVVVDAAVEDAVDVALAASLDAPGAVVVTRRGDRFGAAGWRLRAADQAPPVQRSTRHASVPGVRWRSATRRAARWRPLGERSPKPATENSRHRVSATGRRTTNDRWQRRSSVWIATPKKRLASSMRFERTSVSWWSASPVKRSGSRNSPSSCHRSKPPKKSSASRLVAWPTHGSSSMPGHPRFGVVERTSKFGLRRSTSVDAT